MTGLSLWAQKKCKGGCRNKSCLLKYLIRYIQTWFRWQITWWVIFITRPFLTCQFSSFLVVCFKIHNFLSFFDLVFNEYSTEATSISDILVLVVKISFPYYDAGILCFSFYIYYILYFLQRHYIWKFKVDTWFSFVVMFHVSTCTCTWLNFNDKLVSRIFRKSRLVTCTCWLI